MEILVLIVVLVGIACLVLCLVAAGASRANARRERRKQEQQFAAMRRTKEAARNQIAHLHRAYRDQLTHTTKARYRKEHRPR